jgi:CDP-diacylglycerol--glycerol-3-phosphate 3-phosphatidyltransferase
MFALFAHIAMFASDIASLASASFRIPSGQPAAAMMFRRIGGQTVRCCGRRSFARRSVPGRKFAHTAASCTAAPSAASPLGGITVELDRVAPRFEVPASRIAILDSPAAFYDALKVGDSPANVWHVKLTGICYAQDKIKKARRRIYFSTLYIGKAENELIEILNQALRDNPNLQVSILTDALRGTRETPDPSCASLLSSLVAEHGSERVEIRMFHTPNLTGLRKKWIPRRINEGWGLQHMKLYGIDDEIMLSGYGFIFEGSPLY